MKEEQIALLKQENKQLPPKKPITAKITIRLPAKIEPGKNFKYSIIPPSNFKVPKITSIICSSNLCTLTGTPLNKSFSGILVADALITKPQKGTISVKIIDLANPNLSSKTTKSIIIQPNIHNVQINLKISAKLTSGHSYNFLIETPPSMKPPYIVKIRTSLGRHLIMGWSTTSLGGSVKAWGNGDPDVPLNGSITAIVYDDSGQMGTISKAITIDEPTKEELAKLPMEEPPSWYEKAAKFTWKATKTTIKATGEVLKNTGKAMKAIGEAERKNGFLGKVQKTRQQNASNTYKYKNQKKSNASIPALPKRTWKSLETPNVYTVTIHCSAPGYLTAGYGGAILATFDVTKTPSQKYSMRLPIKTASLPKCSTIINDTLYIKNTTKNKEKIKNVYTEMEKIYQQHLKQINDNPNYKYQEDGVWKKRVIIPRGKFGPFIKM